MRKPRPQGLNLLPAEQKEALARWLMEDVPYSKTIQRMKDVFGVTTSAPALGRFRASHQLDRPQTPQKAEQPETVPPSDGFEIIVSIQIRPITGGASSSSSATPAQIT